MNTLSMTMKQRFLTKIRITMMMILLLQQLTLEVAHNYARPKCYQCNLLFINYDDLAAHVQACHYSFPIFHCTFCDLYFPSTILLADHTRTFHHKSESIVNVNKYSEDHHYNKVML